MPWKPSAPGEVPTLGWYVIDWMTEMLARPAVEQYEPFVPYLEQEDFLLRWYEIDPVTGRFRHDRGLLGRPRGWGKSPVLAAIAAAEGLADVVPDGWDADGQPVGKPWSRVRTPLVHIAAVSEEQTKNTWQPLLEMLREGPVLDEYPGLEPMDTMVNLPRGKIQQVTASARTIKGAPSTFAVLDQTEEWVPSNGGPTLAQNIRTNTSKNGGRTLESPNAFVPGQHSVAEASAAFADTIKSGKALTKAFLYDHREAPADTDLWERESLIAGMRVAYGDSSAHPDGCVIHDPPCAPGHADLEALVVRVWDPASDPQVSRSDFLNQITHASDSYISRPEWNSRSIQTLADVDDPVKVAPLAKGDIITLGFDGSRKRKHGVTDATALIGCRVSDGLLFPIGIWEQPPNAGDDWRIPTDEVDAAVREAFSTYTVVGFYADPAKWDGFVAQWEARYGAQLVAKSTRANPIEWWMTGGRARLVMRALEQFLDAVLNGELIHDGNRILAAHILNARRRKTTGGWGIYKEYPDSPNKIDAAVAAVLAWQARLDAIAAGVLEQPKRTSTKVGRLDRGRR
jgi:hypothetical protein